MVSKTTISNSEVSKQKQTSSELINRYIENNYSYGVPIITKEIYKQFPEIKKGNVRQILNRMVENGIIIRALEGVFYIPKSNNLNLGSGLSTKIIIESKYLRDENRVGYISGINFSNYLGLTQQVASVETIKSNKVSNKKRTVRVNNTKIIVDSPRVEVNDENYKLLQVLDLLNDFKNLSELNLKSATPIIVKYLEELELAKDEIDKCVDSYPLQAQVNFYKMGVYYESVRLQ